MVRSLQFRDGKLVGQNLPPAGIASALLEPSTILWVDLQEPTPEEARSILEGVFQFHPLTVEDCLTETQYPKLEDYGDYLHVVMHEVGVDRGAVDPYPTSELDLFVSKVYLVTFQRRAMRAVSATFERASRGGLTFRGPDRLAHHVLDQLVDNYKQPVSALREEVEAIGEAVLRDPEQALIKRIISVRKELSELNGLVRPQRSQVAQLILGKNKVIRAAMLPYLRDLQDDLLRLEEQTAAAQDQVLLSFRILLNRSSAEANRGIKVLTALTALATPVMIATTWFAMNFPDAPWRGNARSYPVVAGVTLVLTILMGVWLRRKRWM